MTSRPIRCKSCGYEGLTDKASCPQCGTPRAGAADWLRLLPYVLIIAAVLWGLSRLLPSSPPPPGTSVMPHHIATTVEGRVACFKEEDLDSLKRSLSEGEKDAVRSYVKRGDCVVLEGGVTVNVTKPPGVSGDKVQFSYQGSRMWSSRDSLRYLEPE